MTLLEKIETNSVQELIESGEIVSLMIPPYRYRVEEFYNCQVYVSKTVWSELNTVYSKSRDKKSPTRIVYNLMAGSTGRVIDEVEEKIEIFLVYFKGLLPSLNRYRAFRKISLPKDSEDQYLLILSINED
ncbi:MULTISPECIES: hypothetical protein [Leptospira]|uniref:DUF3168 domain-containing protein n=1 Tax=Leptospira licerasiae str. MMD4847 TaxID=1049971 RepID=A0ABN0HB32_9LEPT|nr:MULTISPECIES: hypothetical protein [Leptospira]EIE01393.1 hypothetical protein LEP1GSC185_3455 [Leptospira licerasiae serovar Varillal str. VAR 010]EJZ42786.1 hypothetical protein LEP1GSC178_3068 [Leptospira licerasiae str. MMD4847]